MCALSLRERNNKARREHYDREKEKQEWRMFEDVVVREHSRMYGHQIWHTSMIPESELYDAGIFNDYNKLRFDRIRRRRENNGQVFKYVDYGIDFLSKERGEVPIYHIGQAKHYRSRKVSANDLGTFLLMRFCVPTQSYLYTSGPLEVNLQETLSGNQQHIAHHRLDWSSLRDNVVQELGVVDGLDESTMTRRAYQIDAIRACAGPGRKILEMACGTGKTLVAGNVLATFGAQRIVCVAPLLVSVQNLYDRLQPFLKSHRHVIVDSEGTTDDVDVKAYFDTEDDIVIYTTFKSMRNMIGPVLKATDYLLVDEVHNSINCEELCDIFKRCSNALLLSATIPEDLDNILEAETVYQYNISEAIRDGNICDYEVILPSLTDGRVDVNVPDEWRAEMELAEVHNSMAAKALFLTTGMLQYGNRRCIVYLSKREECDIFIKWIQKVMEEHQGMSVWCGKIDSSVCAMDRKELLKTFQMDDSYDKYIMTSVRILDEAVDIPCCDSEFITSVNDQISEIRTVQRLSRGGRLDPMQPFKKNRMFLWTDEWSKACGMLSLLREIDPDFHTKVRCLCGDYERLITSKSHVLAESMELQTFVQIRCMSLDERFMWRLQQWKEQVARLGRTPFDGSKNADEKVSGRWQQNVRKRFKIGAVSEERIRILNETPMWKWEEDPFFNNLEKWKEMHGMLSRSPSSHSTNATEKSCGQWQSDMRKYYKKGILSTERIRMLEETPGWKWKKEDPFQSNLDQWKMQFARLKRTPSETSKVAYEKSSGQWQSGMRNRYRKGTLSAERIGILNETNGWKWEEEDTFLSSLDDWKKQVARLGKYPSNASKDINEKKSGIWQSSMRNNYRKGILWAERISILEKTPGWKWNELDSFQNNLDHWKELVTRLRKTPSSKSKDADVKCGGQWQSDMRKRYNKGTLSAERIRILNETPMWQWATRTKKRNLGEH
jgi:superfamily II DNA or RNA helicase